MTVMLSGRRCTRVRRALLVAVVLLAGQRNEVFGEDVSASNASPEAVGGAAENTPEACMDPSPMVEALELAKANLRSELDNCEARRNGLDNLMKGLEATVEKQSKVIAAAGGEKGIQELVQAAGGAGDAAVLLEQALAEAEAARGEAAAAEERAGAARKAAGLAQEAETKARKEVAAERERAAQLAAEKETVQSDLKAAGTELATLRKNLTKAEAKESKAREEHDRATKEIRGKLARTASELELAKKPRVVSMAAICADVKELIGVLVVQSKDARDDIIRRASEKVEKAWAIVQPHIEAATKASKPVVKKAMDITAPQRAKAMEALALYRGKFDESVGAPAAEKWSTVKEEISEAWQAAKSKSDEIAEAMVAALVRAGAYENEAQRICRLVNAALLGVPCVLLLVYFSRSIVTYIVWPLLRAVLGLCLWAMKLPFRLLFLPVRLVFWVLAKAFRLVFGRGKKGGGASAPAAGASKRGRESKKRR